MAIELFFPIGSGFFSDPNPFFRLGSWIGFSLGLDPEANFFCRWSDPEPVNLSPIRNPVRFRLPQDLDNQKTKSFVHHHHHFCKYTSTSQQIMPNTVCPRSLDPYSKGCRKKVIFLVVGPLREGGGEDRPDH